MESGAIAFFFIFITISILLILIPCGNQKTKAEEVPETKIMEKLDAESSAAEPFAPQPEKIAEAPVPQQENTTETPEPQPEKAPAAPAQETEKVPENPLPQPEEAPVPPEVTEREKAEIIENNLAPEIKKEKWIRKVTTASQQITDFSAGQLKAVNNVDLDRLINVRGKGRPIAVFVPPKSSNLSLGGAFIYDTRKLPDDALYLFAGPECPQTLIDLAERLMQLMNNDKQASRLERIIQTTTGPAFDHFIHQIGGHISQIQSVKNAGDEKFFEHQFYKSLLHVFIFTDGKMTNPELKKAQLEDLPKHGAAVIDTSDLALYLFFARPHSDMEQENADQNAALKWMSQQPEFNGREVTIFDPSTIPPNLAIIFNVP